MYKNGHVQKWPCTEMAMYKNGTEMAIVQKWPCTKMAMYKNGHVQKWPCTKMAMYKNGHVQKWPCTKMAMYKNGHVQKWPCTKMAMEVMAVEIITTESSRNRYPLPRSILPSTEIYEFA